MGVFYGDRSFILGDWSSEKHLRSLLVLLSRSLSLQSSEVITPLGHCTRCDRWTKFNSYSSQPSWQVVDLMQQIYKYPRTHHIEGSRLQPGDEDLDSVPFGAIASQFTVVEEKVDGANAALSFAPNGQMLLQSRGHYLTGGEREKHFNLFKQWAYTHTEAFWKVLGDRYVLYGEWLYAKHTIFYNALPHYFVEYDVLDREQQQFLSTQSRKELLAELPLVSVPVLFAGQLKSYKQLIALIGNSHYITPEHLEQLRRVCGERGLDAERAIAQTDPTSLMEGLYIKVEEAQTVIARYKYVRPSFLTTMLQSDGHWLNRPIIPNLLHPNADLFSKLINRT